MAIGLAALTLIGSYTAKPLWAQIKSALVQNIDEPGRNPYSSTVFLSKAFPADNCVAAVCDALFNTVPVGKRLVATNVSGNIFLQTPGVVVGGVFFFREGLGLRV
jgi:hypothetical protein